MVAETAFVVFIPTAIYEQMVAHIVAGYPNEACGAVGSVDGRVLKHYPTANAAEHPDDFSEIPPQDLLHISYAIDDYDGEMIYYHSHPQSEAYPSPRDIEWARRSGYLYIIFSHRFYPETPYARVFVINAAGEVSEGRIEIV